MVIKSDAKRVKNEYMKRWRAKNPEKQKEYNRRYWERRAAREASEGVASDGR